MLAAGTGWIFWSVPTALFALLGSIHAEPCARLYMQGLDSTTTVYPQLAGVYKLQTSLMQQWMSMQLYPVYRHELDELFLYYNSSQAALVIGPLQSQGLLQVHRTSIAEITSEVDYSQNALFSFSSWKQWDLRTLWFLENGKLQHMRPRCVDEDFGFCSSGHLHPINLYTYSLQVLGPQFERQDVYFSELYFSLLDNVFYDLRPVYEMVNTGENRTLQHDTLKYYLYHTDGKWLVGADIGLRSHATRIILELEGNAMRVEYENETEWHWPDLYAGSPSFSPSRRKAFGGLRCVRQLPNGTNCQTAGVVACDNGGTCHTNSNGVSACHCPAGYRGIQCEHRVSKCATPFQTPPQASAFGGSSPKYEGSLTTVFCLSNAVQYSLCQNGSWQPINVAECLTTTSTTATTTEAATTTWSPMYNDTDTMYIDRDSTGTIATVVVILVCVQLGFPFLCYCCIACCRSDDEPTDEELPAVDDDLKLEAQKRRTNLQRVCSGFFYMCWWAWLVFVIVYFVRYGYVPLDGSTVLSAVVIMAFVCLGVLYCCVFSESFCSREYKYLTVLENEEVTAGEQITELKVARPTIKFRAECSHNEIKSHTVYGSHGPRTETYTERVKGPVIEEEFVYTDCFDDSVNFCPPQAHVTKVHMELVIEFAENESKRVYEEAYEVFKARHLTRDQFVQFSTKNELPGFVKRLTVHDPDYDVPTWMSSSCFCLASCCCLTWPYRWMFNSAVSSYNYRIVKKILAHPVPIIDQPQSVGDFQPRAEAAALEPNAPPLPVISLDRRPDDSGSIPVVPSDHMPTVPPPSYEEFTANPGLFGSIKRGAHESIPLSEMKR